MPSSASRWRPTAPAARTSGSPSSTPRSTRRIRRSKDAIADEFDAMPGVEVTARDHGTSVAGLIAGTGAFRGMAPGSKIYHARAFEGGKSTMDVILAALDWAAEQDVRIINMSFVGPEERSAGSGLRRRARARHRAGRRGRQQRAEGALRLSGRLSRRHRRHRDRRQGPADAAGQSRALRLRLGARRQHDRAGRRRHGSRHRHLLRRRHRLRRHRQSDPRRARPLGRLDRGGALRNRQGSRRRPAAIRISASASSTPRPPARWTDSSE